MDSLQTCALRLCIKNLKEICSSKQLFSLLWTKFTLTLLIPPSPAILLNMPWVQTVSQYYGSSSLGLFVSKNGTDFCYSQTTIITLLSSLSCSLLLPWCLVVQCPDAVLFFPTLLLSVNPWARRSPGEIKNKKPQPKTYLWTINWYRFLPISQWAFSGLLRPPLIAGHPGLHYSLCLLCRWINTIAWEKSGALANWSQHTLDCQVQQSQVLPCPDSGCSLL